MRGRFVVKAGEVVEVVETEAEKAARLAREAREVERKPEPKLYTGLYL